jgi:hypothetical protein
VATTLRPLELVGAAAGGVALLATALADGPRTALVVALLAGAVVLTRVRYARVTALVVLVLMAGVALSGNGPGEDPRPAADARAAVG